MWKQVIKITAVAGILDIIAAFVQAYLLKGVTPGIVLKYIASGVAGSTAFTGGIPFMLLGLLVHFFIAFCCSISFFFLYPRVKGLQKNVLLNAFIIAIVAWLLTTQVIVPLSRIHQGPFNLAAVSLAVLILYCCIGLPIAYFTRQFYKRKAARRRTVISEADAIPRT